MDVLAPMAVCYSTLCQIVGRQLDRDLVAGQDLDEVLSHFARKMREDLMPLANLYFERSVW